MCNILGANVIIFHIITIKPSVFLIFIGFLSINKQKSISFSQKNK